MHLVCIHNWKLHRLVFLVVRKVIPVIKIILVIVEMNYSFIELDESVAMIVTIIYTSVSPFQRQ